MLATFVNWIYIFAIVELLGVLFFENVSKLIKRNVAHSVIKDIICGIVIATVYAQLFSLVYKVGLVANIILAVICLVTAIKYRLILSRYFQSLKKILFSWEGLFYLGVILAFAFATSRGTIHTDTSMYHAQAIRWYEEYGVVKGLANLQWHFAYNSSYFGFAALFSFGFLSIGPFHCTTGFIAVVMCIWALYHLLDVFKRDKHIADAGYVAILVYALVNYAGFVSPASDYAVNFMVLYLVARWAGEAESGKKDIVSFSLLSVLAVYICTLKMSCGLVVLLALYPIIYLVKEKRGREIVVYTLLGIITVFPFLARNVIISGWLIYPFPALDLFNVDWKLPKEYAIQDSNTIKVWARCLYDTSLADMPIKEWVPIWWEVLENYEQNLLICNVLGVLIEMFVLVKRFICKAKINGGVLLLAVVSVMCSVAWFLLAPFIRYSLSSLLANPLLALGIWLNSLHDMPSKSRVTPFKLVSGMVVAYMFFMSLAYLEHYFMDDMVFIKHNLTEPYYIVQIPYESSEMEEYDMDGITIYTPVKGEVTGYAYFPSATYDSMMENTTLRGTDIKDGFRNKGLE